MSAEPNQSAPVSTAAPDPVAAALAAHSAKLKPEAVGQLATLWRDEFPGLSPNVIKDLVSVRLAAPEYAHFKAEAPAPETITQHGRTMAVLGGRGFAEQVRANMAKNLGGACGLGGQYGRQS